jgi:DNA-binding LytR/AlgR family response regulator
MPEMDGIELAGKLRSNGYRGEIVFLTTSNDFASQSYQVDAFGYLLKPPQPESIRDILQKLENKFKNADKNGISVKAQGVLNFILFRNISYIEVIDHTIYVRLLDGGEIKVSATFTEIQQQLLIDSRFVQCHRSYIVNMNDIEAVTRDRIVMQNGAKVPISRGFSKIRETMMKWIFTRR